MGQHVERVVQEPRVVDLRVRDQTGERAVSQLHRANLDCAVYGNLQHREATVGCHILILFADTLFQDVQLDVARLLGQRLQRYIVSPVVVQSGQQAHQVRA